MPETMAEKEARHKKSEEFVKTCPEIALYFIIHQMGGMAWRLNHDAQRDFSRGHITEDEYNSMLEASKDNSELAKMACAQTVRFGVAKPFDEKGGGSEEYFAWYRWWCEYEKTLSDQEFRVLDNLLTQKSDVSSYRPTGDWRK